METARLTLKKIVPENLYDMYEYSCQSDVTRFLLWSPHLNTDDTRGYIEYLQREYRRGNYADWGITVRESGKMIGTVGFSALDLDNNNGEIGYVLNPAWQGKGYAQEAIRTVLEIAFGELELRRVQARIMDGNTASEHTALACGFHKEGTLRDLLLVKGVYRTIHIYSILNDEFRLRECT